MTFLRRAHRTWLRSTLALGLAAGALAAPGLVAARAFTETVQMEIPLDGVVFTGCEEDVVLSGSLHDTFHITETAAGALTLMIVTNPAGLSATGLESGAMYRGTGTTVQPTHASAWPDGTNEVKIWTSTLVDRIRLVGTAGALTLDIRTVFHVTKVDLVPVVIWDRSEVSCR